jgi:N-acetylneuraminate lyase
MQHLTGLIAAPYTPLTPDGELNLDVVPAYAAVLAEQGLRGAFVGGTTGESLSLSIEEREALAAAWLEAAGEDFAVLVHVGSPSLPDARRLAAGAQDRGASAISAMGPNFFRPRRIGQLVDFCQEVASAADRTPFYYYHIPSMTGVDLSLVEFFRQGGERIPTLTGAKFTHEDLMDFIRAVQLDEGRYNLLFGRDEYLLAGVALGAEGAVGTTYNFAPGLYRQVVESFESGDLASARSAQAQATEMIAVYRDHGGLPAGKEIMKMLGIDVGPPRRPLQPLAGRQVESLRADLQRIGFFGYSLRVD